MAGSLLFSMYALGFLDLCKSLCSRLSFLLEIVNAQYLFALVFFLPAVTEASKYVVQFH